MACTRHKIALIVDDVTFTAIIRDFGGYSWRLTNGRFLRARRADWLAAGGDDAAVGGVIWLVGDEPPAEPDDYQFINALVAQQWRGRISE